MVELLCTESFGSSSFLMSTFSAGINAALTSTLGLRASSRMPFAWYQTPFSLKAVISGLILFFKFYCVFVGVGERVGVGVGVGVLTEPP